MSVSDEELIEDDVLVRLSDFLEATLSASSDGDTLTDILADDIISELGSGCEDWFEVLTTQKRANYATCPSQDEQCGKLVENNQAETGYLSKSGIASPDVLCVTPVPRHLFTDFITPSHPTPLSSNGSSLLRSSFRTPSISSVDRRIAASLGVDPSGPTWTPSMATPSRRCTTSEKCVKGEDDQEDIDTHKSAARTLFSPDLNGLSQEPKKLASQLTTDNQPSPDLIPKQISKESLLSPTAKPVTTSQSCGVVSSGISDTIKQVLSVFSCSPQPGAKRRSVPRRCKRSRENTAIGDAFSLETPVSYQTKRQKVKQNNAEDPTPHLSRVLDLQPRSSPDVNGLQGNVAVFALALESTPSAKSEASLDSTAIHSRSESTPKSKSDAILDSMAVHNAKNSVCNTNFTQVSPLSLSDMCRAAASAEKKGTLREMLSPGNAAKVKSSRIHQEHLSVRKCLAAKLAGSENTAGQSELFVDSEAQTKTSLHPAGQLEGVVHTIGQSEASDKPTVQPNVHTSPVVSSDQRSLPPIFTEFTQISPTLMHSMCEAADTDTKIQPYQNVGTERHSTQKSSINGMSTLGEHNKDDVSGMKETPKVQSGYDRSSKDDSSHDSTDIAHAPVSSNHIVSTIRSRRSRVPRFSYPSTSQIIKSRPQRVFNPDANETDKVKYELQKSGKNFSLKQKCGPNTTSSADHTEKKALSSNAASTTHSKTMSEQKIKENRSKLVMDQNSNNLSLGSFKQTSRPSAPSEYEHSQTGVIGQSDTCKIGDCSELAFSTNQAISGFGFQSASGKSIPISEMSKTKALSLMSDIQEEYKTDKSAEPKENVRCEETAKDFDEDLCDDVDDTELISEIAKDAPLEPTVVIPTSEVYVAARECQGVEGKDFFQSNAENLSSVESSTLKDGIVPGTESEPCNNRDLPAPLSGPEPTKETTSFVGLSCASGKSINISAAGLKRASKLMSDIDGQKDENLPDNTVNINHLGNSIDNKPRTMAYDHKKKRGVTEDICDHAHNDDTVSGETTNIGMSDFGSCGLVGFVGFSCASGKGIQISAAGMKRASRLMSDIDKSKEDDFTNAVTNRSGGKRKSDVSDTTSDDQRNSVLKKSKSVTVSDFGQNEQNRSSREPNASFVGFATARGKVISLSDESKERAAKLMADIQDLENLPRTEATKQDNQSEHASENSHKSEVPLKCKSNVHPGFRPFKAPRSVGNIILPVKRTETPVYTGEKPCVSNLSDTADDKDGHTSQIHEQQEIFDGLDDLLEVASATEVLCDESLEEPGFTQAAFRSEDGPTQSESSHIVCDEHSVLEHIISTDFNNTQSLGNLKPFLESSNCRTNVCGADSSKTDPAASPSKPDSDQGKAPSTKAKSCSPDLRTTVDAEDERKMKDFQEHSRCETTTELMSFPTGPVGFQTAGGKKVNISAKALQKAKEMLDKECQEDLLDCDNSDVKNECFPNPHNSPLAPGATSTSQSDTDLQVGQDEVISSHESSHLMDSDDDMELANVCAGSDPSHTTQTQQIGALETIPTNTSDWKCGFQTASGKKVEVSESALCEVRDNLWGDLNTVGEFPVVGFQTAGGKKVEVSATALEQVKNLWDGVDDKLETTAFQNSVASSTGFKLGFETASGKKVDVSNAALEKVKNLWDGVDENLETTALQNTMHSSKGFKLGFKTASGKKVDVSNAALEKVKNFWEDTDDKTDATMASSSGFKLGFETASGKKVDVSSSALEKVKNLWDEVDEKSEPSVLQNTTLSSTGFKLGFETASGKKVDVSNAALEKVKNLWEDTDNKSDATIASSSGFKLGFETVSGKKVNVSNAALEKVKNFWEGEDDKLESSALQNTMPFSSGYKLGFETASGKKVDVSNAALEKVKNLWDGVDEKSEPSVLQNIVPSSSGFKLGFETASGKKVDVSKAALEKVKNFWEEKDDKLDAAVPSSSGFKLGFETASGKKVDVSSSALEKVKTLWDDTVFSDDLNSTEHGDTKTKTTEINPACDNTETMINATSSDPSSGAEIPAKETFTMEGRPDYLSNVGFHTAGGKAVEVSKSALEKVKLRFQDEFSSEKHITHPVGFATASGKNVAVSSSAMEAVKSLWDEEDVNVAKSCSSEEKMSSKTSVPESIEQYCQASVQSINSTSLEQPPSRLAKTVADQTVKRTQRQPFYSHPAVVLGSRKASFQPMKSSMSSANQTRHNVEQDISPADKPVPSVTKPTVPSTFLTPYKQEPTEKETKSSKAAASSSFVSPFKKTSPPQGDLPSATTFKSPFKSENAPQVDTKSTTEALPSAEDNCESQTDLETNVTEQEVTNEKDVNLICSDEVKKERTKARVQQGRRISEKRKEGNSRPLPGSLWKTRSGETERQTLRSLGQPQTYSPQMLCMLGVRPETINVTSGTAEDFRFLAADYYGQHVALYSPSTSVGDGGLVVWDEKGAAGKQEFTNALFDMRGVEPSLISPSWVHNHYRWIVWKLAAMEVAFPHQFGGRLLTPDNVMYRLKYRYDREVDLSHRSALKKIYERDDAPQRSLVLCVSALQRTHPVSMELTDGWYAIRAELDGALQKLVRAGRVRVGDKLVTHGAELTGSTEASTPLEGYSSVSLKLCGNGTRRARWYTSLGYLSSPHPPSLPLSSLFPDGGLTPAVDVMVTRVYPLQYMEKLSDGSKVFRHERAEQKEARTRERQREAEMERLYSSVLDQMQLSQDAKTSKSHTHYSARQVAALQTGPELYTALSSCGDPAAFQSELSSSQREVLSGHRQMVEDQRQAAVRDRLQQQITEQQTSCQRSVTPLLKVRVAGCMSRDIDTSTATMLTVWRPSDDVGGLLQEGSRLRIYNLSASEPRGRLGQCGVSLTATRSTRYQLLPTDDNLADLVYEPREVVSFSELVHSFRPPYGEVDIVGVVVRVSAQPPTDRIRGEVVYLMDDRQSLVALSLRSSLKALCWHEVVSPGALIAASNLLWSRESCLSLPLLTVTDHTQFTQNPTQAHLKVAMSRLRRAQELQSNISDAQRKLHSLLSPCVEKSNIRSSPMISPVIRRDTPSDVTKPRPHTSNSSPCTPVNSRSVSMLDSTPEDASPALLRQRALQKRKLSKLEAYGDHTGLQALQRPSTRSAAKCFKPPRVLKPVDPNKTPNSDDVTSP